jgi:LAO/AO transport system kinase
VVTVAALPPASGIDELVAALDAHRSGLDLAAVRVRARRLGALADFVAEHGERGLRGVGGRRAAVRWLEEQDPGLAEPELVRALEQRDSPHPDGV